MTYWRHTYGPPPVRAHQHYPQEGQRQPAQAPAVVRHIQHNTPADIVTAVPAPVVPVYKVDTAGNTSESTRIPTVTADAIVNIGAAGGNDLYMVDV